MTNPLTPARVAELRRSAEAAGGIAIPSVELLALLDAWDRLREVEAVAAELIAVTVPERETFPAWEKAMARWLAVRGDVLSKEGDADE